jgi:predicted transcriptional regulator with HTH domain
VAIMRIYHNHEIRGRYDNYSNQQFGGPVMTTWQEEIRDKYGYEIITSLKRSRSRTRSLLYIGMHPNKTITEISIGIGLSYANTYGAIIGDGKKYSKEHSLTGMGLVSYKTIGNARVCELMELGEKIFEKLKEQPTLVT